MLHLVAPSRFEPDPIKGSRFVADVRAIERSEQAKPAVAELRAEFPGASHHCWAWRLSDERQQSSDDGEPGGSAGRPILAQIAGHQVVNVLVVVVRWFGGTKLGVGGLVRAYGGAAGQALDRARLEPFVPTIELEVEHGYEDGAAVDAVLKAHHGETLDAHYGARVARRVKVPASDGAEFGETLRNATAGRVQPHPAGES